MKRKLTKKLTLNKKTVSNLTHDEMHRVRGATLLLPCTDSCSVVDLCCPATTEENAMRLILGEDGA